MVCGKCDHCIVTVEILKIPSGQRKYYSANVTSFKIYHYYIVVVETTFYIQLCCISGKLKL